MRGLGKVWFAPDNQHGRPQVLTLPRASPSVPSLKGLFSCGNGSFLRNTTLTSRAMNRIRHTDKAYAATLRALTTQSSLFDPAIEERTRAILQDVQTRGDQALLELTERFDGAKLTIRQLAVSKAELLS